MAITTYQPYLVMNQLISVEGIFPSPNLGGTPFIASIGTFAGNFAPRGDQFADGSLYAIAENDALFALIGTTYGGDGQTTFAMPDMVGRTLVGEGQGPGLSNHILGEEYGALTTSPTLAQLPSSLGGGNQAISTVEPTLTVTYGIALQGIFPSRNFTDGTEQAGASPFLAEIGAFAGNFVPRGWAECSGQLLSIAQNQALFALLGTTYGGNGTTNFALPDLRGRTIVGTGGEHNYQLGQVIGSETRTLTSAEAPNPLTGQTQNSFDGTQPSLAMNHIIALQGTFPARQFTDGTESGGDATLGEVLAFAGNFAPRGWAFCEGQILPISQNTALFSLLGTTYGGDGRTTFALPDLRGRSIIGAGSNELGTFNLGETGGQASQFLTAADLPNVAPNITSDGALADATITKVDATTLVTTVTANDINAPAQTLTYSIAGGEDSLLFTLDANHQLKFVNAPDLANLNGRPAEGATAGYQVNVSVSDGSLTDTQNITVLLSPNAHQTGNTVDYSDAIGGVYVDIPTSKGHRAGNGLGWQGGPLSLTAIAIDSLPGLANIKGSAFSDLLVGDNAANRISGGAGMDVLFGQGGDDVLLGGAAPSTTPNQLWGGADNDTASYEGETEVVNASLEGFWGYVGGVAATNLRDTFNSIENLIGGDAADTLTGDANRNVLTGGNGADVLFGQAGNDLLIGGATTVGLANQLWGGEDSDTASYENETTAVNADLQGQRAFVGGVAAANLRDTFNSIENLKGGSAGDMLAGDANANVLVGGAGADRLFGRGGSDTFDYTEFSDSRVSTGYDTIADFETGIDHLDLSAFNTDAAHIEIQLRTGSTVVRVLHTAGSFDAANDLAISIIGNNAIVMSDIIL